MKIRDNGYNFAVFSCLVVISYLIAVLSIQLVAPDVKISSEEFPVSCPKDSNNCSMIAPNSHRANNLTELRFESELSIVMHEANKWIESKPRSKIIGEWENHTHAVFHTPLLRFPDDFVISGSCDNGETVILVYSKSRLGISDLGLNPERVSDFSRHMSNIEMPTSYCS